MTTTVQQPAEHRRSPLGLNPVSMPETRKTAVAYLRISADPEELRAGVTRQREDVEALAARLGADLVMIFEDNDISASKARRAKSGWAQMLKYLAEHKPNYLLAFKMDRLSRRLSDMEDLETYHKGYGLDVVTVAEGSVFANTAWPLLVSVAKMEASNTSFRIRRMQEDRRTRGLDPVGGNRPYGYAVDRMTVIPEEAAVIEEAARRIISGESASSICRDFDARGIKRANNAARWSARVLRDILSRPRYVGLRVRNVGTRKDKRYEVAGKAKWPAILDLTTFDRVQARLGSTAVKRTGRPFASLLGGIVRCGKCQTAMYAAKVDAGRETYRCSAAAGGCGRVHRSRATLDGYVKTLALSMINEEVAAGEAEAVKTEADSLADKSNQAELQRAELREAYAEGKISGADYFATLDALGTRIRQLDREHRAAVTRLFSLTEEQTARQRWDGWTTDQRRTFLRSKFAAVLVFPSVSRGVGARVIRDGELSIIPA